MKIIFNMWITITNKKVNNKFIKKYFYIKNKKSPVVSGDFLLRVRWEAEGELQNIVLM